MTPALNNFCNSMRVCSLETSESKFGFFWSWWCSHSMASLAVKQSSYVLKCFRCFLRGIPSWRLRTMLFHSLVALQGPSSTKLLSIIQFSIIGRKKKQLVVSWAISFCSWPRQPSNENKFRRARAQEFSNSNLLGAAYTGVPKSSQLKTRWIRTFGGA